VYNGVGLNTPRGSGTSGHVQKNAATVRTKTDYAEARRKEEARKDIVIPPVRFFDDVVDDLIRLIQVDVIDICNC
jgi:hypothetical protein